MGAPEGGYLRQLRTLGPDELRSRFPKLVLGTYQKASNATARYNCMAYANGDERFDAVEEEVVEFGAGLASNFDGVFEAFRGDEGGARAFVFEKRVGADRGAVEEDEFAFVGDFAEGFDDGLGGIGWRGENFEHAQATCVDPDAVGKGAAGVDGDAEWLGAAGHGDSGILG